MILLAISVFCFFLLIVANTISAASNEALLSFAIGSTPKTPEVHLENFSDMTATVQLYINETSLEKRDENIIVNAPKNHGVMVFVKTLHFRALLSFPNSTKNASDTVQDLEDVVVGCKDFIKFKTSVSPQGDEFQTICREVEEKDPKLKPSLLIGPRVFHEPLGRINISVHTSYYTVLPRKPLAELVFTAISDCSEREATNLTRCSPSFASSCIPKSLACDGKVHCAFADGFGSDEDENLCRKKTVFTPVVKSKDFAQVPEEDETDYRFRNYFIPTGLIFFMIWGIITMIRKCYKCYKDDKEKEEMYY